MKILQKKIIQKVEQQRPQESKEVNDYIEAKKRELQILNQELQGTIEQYNQERGVLIQDIQKLTKHRASLLVPVESLKKEVEKEKEKLQQENNNCVKLQQEYLRKIQEVELIKTNTSTIQEEIQKKLEKQKQTENTIEEIKKELKRKQGILQQKKEHWENIQNNELERLNILKEQINEQKILSEIKEQSLIRKEKDLVQKEKLIKSRQKAIEALKKEYGQ